MRKPAGPASPAPQWRGRRKRPHPTSRRPKKRRPKKRRPEALHRGYGPASRAERRRPDRRRKAGFGPGPKLIIMLPTVPIGEWARRRILQRMWPMPVTYESWLVLLSIGMAIQGAYVGLSLAVQIGGASGMRRRLLLAGVDFSLDVAVW